jgi:hypothetical protein
VYARTLIYQPSPSKGREGNTTIPLKFFEKRVIGPIIGIILIDLCKLITLDRGGVGTLPRGVFAWVLVGDDGGLLVFFASRRGTWAWACGTVDGEVCCCEAADTVGW